MGMDEFVKAKEAQEEQEKDKAPKTQEVGVQTHITLQPELDWQERPQTNIVSVINEAASSSSSKDIASKTQEIAVQTEMSRLPRLVMESKKEKKNKEGKTEKKNKGQGSKAATVEQPLPPGALIPGRIDPTQQADMWQRTRAPKRPVPPGPYEP